MIEENSTFFDLLNPGICLHEEDRISLSPSSPPLRSPRRSEHQGRRPFFCDHSWQSELLSEGEKDEELARCLQSPRQRKKRGSFGANNIHTKYRHHKTEGDDRSDCLINNVPNCHRH